MENFNFWVSSLRFRYNSKDGKNTGKNTMLQRHDAYKICHSKRIKNLVGLFGLNFIIFRISN